MITGFRVILLKECWERQRGLVFSQSMKHERENGSQDCNVYVFNRYPQSKKAMYSKN